MMIPDKIKILYIEDDKESAISTMEYLSKASISEFEVVHTCTLEKGLEYLDVECKLEETCDIDVIVLDLILPNSDGINLYKSVVDKCPFIPVVIISEYEDMAIQCVRLGAQDYLFKPDYNGGTLTRSITYAVQRDYLIKKYERERDISKMYLDVAGVMLLVLNIDQTVSMINKKGCEILNCSEEEVVGKNWFDHFIPEKIRKDVKEVFDKVIAGDIKAVEFYGNPIKTRDGTEKYISWHNSTIKNANGKIIKILSSGEDVTEMRAAEGALKKAEQQFRNLVEVTKAAIYEIDLINQKFTYVNDVMCKLTGWDREELMKKNPTDILSKESANHFRDRMKAMFSGEWIDPSCEYEVIVKDGSTKWALITVQFKENKNKEVVAANVVAIDITEKKLAIEESKRKEEVIFEQLESRIHDWKQEMSMNTLANDATLREISLNINSIHGQEELINDKQ